MCTSKKKKNKNKNNKDNNKDNNNNNNKDKNNKDKNNNRSPTCRCYCCHLFFANRTLRNRKRRFTLLAREVGLSRTTPLERNPQPAEAEKLRKQHKNKNEQSVQTQTKERANPPTHARTHAQRDGRGNEGKNTNKEHGTEALNVVSTQAHTRSQQQQQL